MDRAEFLRPSGAATWIVCSGYVAMRAAYPDIPDEADNDVREDGTACHWLAAEVWQGRTPKEGSLSPNNRVIDEDMYDAVDMYLDVLRAWSVPAHIEQPMDCSAIFKGMKGTPDAWAYDPVTRTIYIADLKYGFRFVEVWYNWQVLCYVLAILALLGINGLEEQYVTVKAYIVQPRSNHRDGPKRTWTARVSDLRPYFNDIKRAAEMAMSAEPMCTPNPHCNDCPARHACVALQNSALGALEQSYAGMPLELTPAAIADELRRLQEASKRMEARITGLQGQAEALIRSGKVVPGYGLETTYARERWQEGKEGQVIALGQLLGKNLAEPSKPISPARVRKLVPKGMTEMFSHKPSTGVRLSKSDPLEAIKKFHQHQE